jgi:outer membrane lipoprotein SlyB
MTERRTTTVTRTIEPQPAAEQVVTTRTERSEVDGDEEVGGAVAGAVGGALVGTAVGGPVGTVVGGAIGAVAGATAGTADEQSKEKTVVEERTTR